MQVTVIIPTFNGEKYIGSCLSSLQRQHYHNIRILIIDNCSTDQTVCIAQNFKVNIIAQPYNIGFAKACNLGVKYSQSDFIACLNQDTIVHRDWLAELVECATITKADAVASNILPLNSYPGTNKFYGRPIWFVPSIPGLFWGEPTNMVLQHINFVAGTAFLIKREIIETMSYMFDDRYFMYHEDIDLSVRLIAHKAKIIFVPRAVVWHDDSISDIAPYYVIRNLHPLIFKNFGLKYYIKIWTKLLMWNLQTLNNLKKINWTKNFIKSNFDGIRLLAMFKRDSVEREWLVKKIIDLIPPTTMRNIIHSLKYEQFSKDMIFHG